MKKINKIALGGLLLTVLLLTVPKANQQANAAKDPKVANLDTYTMTTPAPTDRPIGQVVGTTKVVGHEAVVLIDHETMQVRSGSDVDMEALFPADFQIANWQYYMEKDLRSMEVERGCVDIGDFAFARSGLRNITLPKGLMEIGYAAFYHCDDMEDILIPDTVTRIGEDAFGFTPWLKSFMNGERLPDEEFLVVGDGCLIAYRGDDPIVVVPYGVKYIGHKVFENHREIVDVMYPDTIEYIEDDAFKGCEYKPAY
ncbi:MAG: leucine-rich repeat domain-containing protein [Lachnospiraceae bacterium]|nr:leucine-rich repeat domain-containing protein [Lachnospiraceae bacterium]